MGLQMLNGVPYGSVRQIQELTQAEYDALPSSKYTDGILYCITDDGMVEGNKFAPVIYSTEEQEIGTWIDGKPLYEKTLIIPNTVIDNTGGQLYTHGISNIEKCVSVRGYIQFSTGGIQGGRTQKNDWDLCNAIYGFSPTQIYMNIGKTWNESANKPDKILVTVQYTKTTDVPGSGKWSTYGVPNHHYSTNEQVIGTWIDGKPIYEITFDFYDDIDWNIGYNAWSGTGKYIQNCGRILKATCSSNAGVYTEVMAYSDSDHIKVQTPRNSDTTQCRYLTIQYTKTTD